VLIRVGGLLLGDSAVDLVVSIVSLGCVNRIVARSDCMFVWGTTSKVHVISPLVGGGGFGSGLKHVSGYVRTAASSTGCFISSCSENKVAPQRHFSCYGVSVSS
jgi:hypothetical protein